MNKYTKLQGKTRKLKRNIYRRTTQFCEMQKQLDKIKEEVVERIRIVFLRDFDGNNRKFARAVGCNEKSIRSLFEQNQGMTLNMLFKIASAIKTTPSELLSDLEFKKED